MRKLGMDGYDNKRKPSIVAFVNTARCLWRRFIMGFSFCIRPSTVRVYVYGISSRSSACNGFFLMSISGTALIFLQRS